MGRRPSVEPTPGLLLVDKPQGWTSHDVVGRCRRLAGTRKVGHAGTLDPMATGLLVLGIGRATKLLTYITGHDKAYDATIRLGQSTVTDDAEGDVTSSADAAAVTEQAIAAAVAVLTGDIMQRPSSVSAIKVDGKRSYARVRGGEDVELPARPVTVSRFDVGEIRREGDVIDLDVTVEVSSGTYVRALARDLGDALGVGGHLTALRRTRVGSIPVTDAATLDALSALVEEGEPLPLLPLGASAAATLTSATVGEDDARALGYGQWVEATVGDDGEHLALLDASGDLVAIGERRGGKVKPVVVMKPAGSAAQ
ncbi:tRNA pseudouridine(55) synthase TruB [Demequina zhanjiangensis]|uniref:tRNA pseudouridine synthase B n=1 Tax=Demequina zhanjiangensis TaxID=3051659 RepID=A0ABT8G383_9MICO|nr:tRNA pseudouridine(55) synthase TruB [Demequina sp. SYSU T00b26]MDN4473606.1 tRNA pseudouridine(55) synthase TruB [Demequina sp. SYSU T00b26]